VVDWKTGRAREGYDEQVLGYALYLSTPEDKWASSQDVFQTAADTSKPAG